MALHYADEWLRSGCSCCSLMELVKERANADFDYTGELKALEQMHRELQGLSS